MLPSEVADLLVLNAALDRYASVGRVSKEQAIAWAAVIDRQAPDLTFVEARGLVVDHYGLEEESLTPFRLVEAYRKARRLLPNQVEADVRVAKALGIVDSSWPKSDPLPEREAVWLAQVRADRASEQLALSGLKQLEPGAVE